MNVGRALLTVAVCACWTSVGRCESGPQPPAAPAGLQIWNQNAAVNIFVKQPRDPAAALEPVRMSAPRNGASMGAVVVGAPATIKGLKVQVSDLAGPEAIPASAVRVRYMLPDGQTASPTKGVDLGASFDTLAEAPPAEVAPDAKTKLAVQPLWITVNVPEAAKPGDYSGTLTVSAEGLPAVKVALALQVAGWRLPAPKDYSTQMDFFESAESVALRYGVEMWSDAHLKLLDKNFELLAPLAAKTLYITAVRRTHLGNEQAMVQWVRGAEGQLEPDLGVVEKYLDVARKRLGPIPSVVLYCWEPPYSQGHAGNPDSPGRQHDRPILLTLRSTKTGKIRAITGPDWGTPESTEMWGKLSRAMQKALADRGMGDSLLFGIMGDHRPTKAAMDEIANAAPQTKWAVHSHFYCLTHHGYKVGLCAAVWGIGCTPTEAGESGYGWRSPFRLTLNSRYDLGQYSPMSVWMALAEKWLGAKAGGKGSDDNPLNGTKGMGRMGADFWLVLKDGRGEPNRRRLCGRYPESAWGQLSLENCTTAVLTPGPDGPLSTARAEGLRQCVQAMEARISMERALLDKEQRAKLGDDLAGRARKLIDDRRRTVFHGGDTYAKSDWVASAGGLYALAQEVAEKLAAGKGEKP
jgi:hypothetical protein